MRAALRVSSVAVQSGGCRGGESVDRNEKKSSEELVRPMRWASNAARA